MGLITIDASGTILGMDAAAAGLLGLDQTAGCGSDLSRLLANADAAGFQERLSRLREAAPEQGVIDKFDCRIRRNGGEVPIRLEVRPLPMSGVAAWLVEVTERGSEKMGEADAARWGFLAAMSHELRTPMTAIVGYVDLLMRSAHREEDRIEWTREIRRSAQLLLAMLNNVLDISQIDAGRLELNPERCSLAAVLSAIGSIMRPAAKEKGLMFEVVAEGPIPAAVTADPARLRQVLMNLVDNAIKFTDRGGVRLVARLDGGAAPRVRFEVRDTGIGIDEQTLAGLFRPFTQAHGPGRGRPPGTGLGLALSRRLMERMGGSLSGESRPGSGSVFTASLPVTAGEAGHCVETGNLVLSGPIVDFPRDQTPNLGGLRILLVDDNPDNRRILESLLAETTALVVLAEDGREAVEVVGRAHGSGRDFDLILMDMQMPVMDGYAAAAAMRALGVRTPIVAVTAFAMAGDESKCIGAGCDDYLAKPIQPREFFSVVAGWLFLPPAGSEDEVMDLTSNPAIAELAAEFRQELPGRAEEIRAALAAGDAEKVRSCAHRLRGTAASLGMPEISRAAGEAEDTLVRSPGSNDARRAVARMLASIEFALRRRAEK